MFNINWAIRLKDNSFKFQLLLAVLVPIGSYFGLSAADLTSWGAVWETAVKALSNPYVLALVATSVVNAVRDPTTKGMGDSKDVLDLESVYEDGVEVQTNA